LEFSLLSSPFLSFSGLQAVLLAWPITMDTRWGWRAALLAAVLLIGSVRAEIAHVSEAGETPASALEAVSVS